MQVCFDDSLVVLICVIMLIYLCVSQLYCIIVILAIDVCADEVDVHSKYML